MKRLFFVNAWLLLSTGVIITSIAAYHFFLLYKEKPPTASENSQNVVMAAAQEANQEIQAEGDVKGVQTILETEDGRAELVANFLQRHDAPLKPYDEYGKKIVEIADRYGIDFRLLPAIAMQESNLCKKIPEGSFNCLGFGIHERGTLGFESYEANFERAARELKKNYIDIGLTTPAEIMTKYTPSSNGSWAESVNQWMAEMRYDDRQLGRELKTNANLLEFAQETPPPSPTPNI
jgi:hypothetical protein